VIAFGCAIVRPRIYDRCAAPGVQLAAEPDSEILLQHGGSSIFRSYNLLLDRAKALDGIEALVVVHEDAEILTEDLCARIRETLSDPEVGLIGCVGAIGVRSIAWWEGSVSWANFCHRYLEFGSGEVKGLTWDPEQIPTYAETGEVDSIDGFAMVFSPWAIESVRFDESLWHFHGYDYDYCLQVRAAGKKVVTADFRVIHHHSLALITDLEGWIAAHMRVAEKWKGQFLDDGYGKRDWEQWARRAEAEAAGARMMGAAESLVREAEGAESKRRIEELERELSVVYGSRSWRITRPTRALRRVLQARRTSSHDGEMASTADRPDPPEQPEPGPALTSDARLG
jgi:hypothetical protein